MNTADDEYTHPEDCATCDGLAEVLRKSAEAIAASDVAAERAHADSTSLERYQEFVAAIVEKFSVCPACSYLWSECDCGVGAATLEKAQHLPTDNPMTTRCNAVIDLVGEGDEADWHECDLAFGHNDDHFCHCDFRWPRADTRSVGPLDEYRGQ